MKLELSKSEAEAVLGLLDAGVRATGLRAVQIEVVSVLRKLEQAVSEAEKSAIKGDNG